MHTAAACLAFATAPELGRFVGDDAGAEAALALVATAPGRAAHDPAPPPWAVDWAQHAPKPPPHAARAFAPGAADAGATDAGAGLLRQFPVGV